MFKKVWKGFLAGITSPEAVKAEKSIGVLVAVRVAIALGAGGGIIEIINKLGG